MSALPVSAPALDVAAFRNALGRFATGITVVTAAAPDGTPVGLTVNSFNSLSLEPPLVLWSLGNQSAYRTVFEQASHYAIHILTADQEELSQRFAMRQEDRFAGLDWQPGPGGAPLLSGCCATFEVANEIRHPGGDHLLFIGQVERFSHDPAAVPLLYFGGAYRRLAD